jgi:hypothetical protein
MTFVSAASSRSFGGGSVGGFFNRTGGVQHGGSFIGMMMRRGLTGTVGRQAQRKLLGTAVTKTAKSASKSTKKGLKFKKGRVAKKPKVATTSVKKKQAQLAIKGPNRKAIAGPKLSKSYPVATRKTNYPVSVYKPRTSTTVTRTTSAGKSTPTTEPWAIPLPPPKIWERWLRMRELRSLQGRRREKQSRQQ